VSWRDAPLYVRCHDLALDLARRVDGDPSAPCPELRRTLAREGYALLRAVSLALSFPGQRRREQQLAADGHVAALKVQLRLARELELISPGGARRLGEELVEIGRMIGGWRRRHAGPGRRPSGGEPSSAPGG